MTAHQRAVEHLKTAAAIKLELDDLRAIKTLPRPSGAIEKSGAELRLSLKLAEIEATLAVAEAFQEWTTVGREGLEAVERPAAVLVSLPSKRDVEDES